MPSPSLIDRLRDWRTRQVARPEFQRFAARFLLTRPVANTEATRLFQDVTGFVRSQILFACVELGVLDALRSGQMEEASVLAATGLPDDAARRLLQGAAALQLIRRGKDGQWRLADLGAIVAADAGIIAMIRHHAMLYRDLADPVALLKDPSRQTETRRYWAYAATNAAPSDPDAPEVAAYSELMAASQAMVFRNVLDAYSFAKTRRLMDIGGGSGAFLEAAAARWPTLQATLFDLPAAARLAEAKFEAAGLSERAKAHGGDFFNDDLPKGADCVILSRILCDHDDARAKALLANVWAAMEPGATLLIAEPFADDTAAGRAVGAYFSMYFLAMGQGRSRSFAELAAFAESAGFKAPKRKATPSPLLSGLLVTER